MRKAERLGIQGMDLVRSRQEVVWDELTSYQTFTQILAATLEEAVATVVPSKTYQIKPLAFAQESDRFQNLGLLAWRTVVEGSSVGAAPVEPEQLERQIQRILMIQGAPKATNQGLAHLLWIY